MRLARLPLPLVAAAALAAHPMGNFSVSHYTRIEPGARGASLHYVLDLAEIPTFELLQKWGLDRASPELRNKARAEADGWARNLKITVNGRGVAPRVESTAITLADGAGGLPVARIETRLHLPVSGGKLEFEDRNYPYRAGWKEIVIAAGKGAAISRATHGGRDRSRALTAYPQDPSVDPPQDLRAAVEWSGATAQAKSAPVIEPVAQPVSKPHPSPASPSAPGTVVRGDYLSSLLGGGEIGFGMTLLGLAAAFGLGAAHALSPGHGKTIVAAYLVGARGTAKHALFLGSMVTFTHTISVFALGFVTMFLSTYVAPEKITPALEVISGLSIVCIGATLLYKRIRALGGHHHHAHPHDHHHPHDHDHGPHGHSHAPEGEVTLGSLIALGASGGLVPCPSALILLLAAIRLDRTGLGLILLVGFSAGLAAVLTAIGLAVLYAKHLLPAGATPRWGRAARLVPVFSAGTVLCLGLVMTGVSLQ